MADEIEFDCEDCGATITEEELREANKPSYSDGKVQLNCPECSNRLSIQFYCGDCDEWVGGRIGLKWYDNGSVAKYVCPSCDGWIRKGNVLEVRQGVHR